MVERLKKTELLDKVEQMASKCEREVHGCGRCALAPLIKHFELADESCGDLMLKGILPLSGGIAQTRNTCAAALGGMMAIGMVYFQKKSLEDAVIDEIKAVMALSREYYREFEKEIGHIRCFDIREAGLGRVFDTSDPDEYEKFVKAGAYDLCCKVCGKAARLAGEYILRIKEEEK